MEWAFSGRLCRHREASSLAEVCSAAEAGFNQPLPLHAVPQAGASVKSVLTGDKSKDCPVCSKPPGRQGPGLGST